jgi:glycosyltransferase involved in cell wall biosynthesis
VIIVGETFRLNGGGGITMSNLFKDWPDENIGVVTSLIDETNPNTGYRYYQLGYDEVRFPFPFNLIQNKAISGEYFFSKVTQNTQTSRFDNSFAIRLKKRLRLLFDKVLSYTGLSLRFNKISLSANLKSWIMDFSPDIIYIQPFLYRYMRFGNLLFQELKIPYAIHIMDDSISFINKSLICKKRVQTLMEKDFAKMIANASVRMCISESMATEYELRYGEKIQPFRNPIEVEKWLPFQKKHLEVNSNELKIIYTGRLFPPTFSSLVDLCHIVDRFNKMGMSVKLDIFTYDVNRVFSELINELYGINLQNPVSVSDIPLLVQYYDIFFMCLDFDDHAMDYAKFSISTRTSEGMISSVPILMYGPAASAMHKFFSLTNAAYLVGERSQALLGDAVTELWHNKSLREKLSSNAASHVIRHNNASTVREHFRQELSMRLS